MSVSVISFVSASRYATKHLQHGAYLYSALLVSRCPEADSRYVEPSAHAISSCSFFTAHLIHRLRSGETVFQNVRLLLLHQFSRLLEVTCWPVPIFTAKDNLYPRISNSYQSRASVQAFVFFQIQSPEILTQNCFIPPHWRAMSDTRHLV